MILLLCMYVCLRECRHKHMHTCFRMFPASSEISAYESTCSCTYASAYIRKLCINCTTDVLQTYTHTVQCVCICVDSYTKFKKACFKFKIACVKIQNKISTHLTSQFDHYTFASIPNIQNLPHSWCIISVCQYTRFFRKMLNMYTLHAHLTDQRADEHAPCMHAKHCIHVCMYIYIYIYIYICI